MTLHTRTDACLNVVSWKQELSHFPCRQTLIGWDRPPVRVASSCRSLTCPERTSLRSWARPLHCSQLQQLSLSRNLRTIEQEAFLQCASLQEVCIPPSLLYIARRAFAGCTQLRVFRKMGKSKTWRGTYARINAFDKCEQLDKPTWLRFLPPNAKDQWREDFREAIS